MYFPEIPDGAISSMIAFFTIPIGFLLAVVFALLGHGWWSLLAIPLLPLSVKICMKIVGIFIK